jgi:molecular chaperone GrpE
MSRESTESKKAILTVEGVEELYQQALDIQAQREQGSQNDPINVLNEVDEIEEMNKTPDQDEIESKIDATVENSVQWELMQAQQQKLEYQQHRLNELERALALSEQNYHDTEQERQKLYDRLLRLSADFDNLRKRTAREKEDFKKFGHEDVMREFLTIVDSFDRAINSLQDAPPSLLEGFEMLYRQLIDVLARYGVKCFESKGQPFDYTYHEALSVFETSDVPPNTVLEEFQSGYMIHDKLLRAARVIVSKAPAISQDTSQTPTSDTNTNDSSTMSETDWSSEEDHDQVNTFTQLDAADSAKISREQTMEEISTSDQTSSSKDDKGEKINVEIIGRE